MRRYELSQGQSIVIISLSIFGVIDQPLINALTTDIYGYQTKVLLTLLCNPVLSSLIGIQL